MNLPNKLTVIRMIMIPFFVFFFYASSVPYHMLIALIIFAVASLTDMLDGMIARKHGLVTDFGKLMDPLADKLLVTTACICILMSGYRDHGTTSIGAYVGGFIGDPMIMGAIVLIILVSRDLIVNAIRVLAANKGVVIAADKWGKFKTISQMVWVCLALLRIHFEQIGLNRLSFFRGYAFVETFFYMAMILLTIISGFNYVWHNRQMFADG